MVFIGRRFFAACMAFTWLVLSLVVPVSAHAATYNAASNLTGRQWFVPAQSTGVAGTAIVATAATMLARANPWIAAISLGTPVMQYLLEINGGDRVAIRARDAQVPTPPGWTSNPNGIPSPPSQSPTISTSPYQATPGVKETWYCFGSYCSDPQPTAQQACSLLAPAYGWPSGALRYDHPSYPGQPFCYNASGSPDTGTNIPTVQVCQGGAQTQTCSLSCPNGGTLSGTTCTPAPSCSPGYALSQGYCTIIDPTAVKWPSDGVPTYVPTQDGSGIQPDPRDPDPAPASPSPSEILNPSAQYHPDPYGNPTLTQITPQPGGGYTIDQRVQTTNNNQTMTTINNITINNNGNVVNISSTTVPGSIEQASPAAVPVAQKIEFPNDYNREATQQQVLQKLDDIKTGAGAADAPNYDVAAKAQAMNDAVKEKIDAIPGEYAADKGSWFSWVWTPPIGQCEPWNSTIHGQSVSWNICPYVDKVRDVIGYLLAVASAFAVYSQLFRRED